MESNRDKLAIEVMKGIYSSDKMLETAGQMSHILNEGSLQTCIARMSYVQADEMIKMSKQESVKIDSEDVLKEAGKRIREAMQEVFSDK